VEDLIFSFFPSYYAFARNLPDAERLAFYDAILDYFFEGVEPSGDSPVYSAFLLIQPNINNSKRAKLIGRNGGLKGKGVSRNAGNKNALKNKSNPIGRNNSRSGLRNNSANQKVEGIGEGNGEGKIDKLPPAPTFDAHLAFDEFWKAYPSECPRKTDKKKCAEKYARLMRDAKDPAALHKTILDGLAVWKRCDTWTRDSGQFIRAPLVWLNGNNWCDEPLAEGASAAQSPEEADALEAIRQANAMSAAAARDGGLPI
jgi:hypothetical protein